MAADKPTEATARAAHASFYEWRALADTLAEPGPGDAYVAGYLAH